jgi:hypothetical protein
MTPIESHCSSNGEWWLFYSGNAQTVLRQGSILLEPHEDFSMELK